MPGWLRVASIIAVVLSPGALPPVDAYAAAGAAVPTPVVGDSLQAGPASALAWLLRDIGDLGAPAPMLTADAARTRGARTLAEPSGILCDAFGRVWVSDAALHEIVRWQADGVALDEAGALGSEPGQFRRPGALARVGSLGVAVLDVENRRVSTYDHHLRLLGAAVDFAAPELEQRIGRVRPVSLASDRGGALYVADAEHDRVLVFDYAGQFLREMGGFGGRSGGFAGLLGLATGPHGTLVTVERPRGRSRRTPADDTTVARSRVQWLDAAGRVTAARWSPAWGAGAAEVSLAVAVDDSGRVALAAERSGELCVFSSSGVLLARMGGLAAPRALTFDATGVLLVAEAGSARVRRLVLEPVAGE